MLRLRLKFQTKLIINFLMVKICFLTFLGSRALVNTYFDRRRGINIRDTVINSTDGFLDPNLLEQLRKLRHGM